MELKGYGQRMNGAAFCRTKLCAVSLWLVGCALPHIHRDTAPERADAGVHGQPGRDTAASDLADAADVGAAPDAGKVLDPKMDPANRNEDFETFKTLLPKEHVFAEWPMPDSSEHSKVKPSYSVSQHVITDNVTKLRWQRVLPAIYRDCKGNFEYVSRMRGVGSGCTWEEAQAYCRSPELAAQLGSGNWRLPTKIELESLVDVSRINAVDPLFDGFPISFVWTSSPVPNPIPDGLKMSCNVDFSDGVTNMGGRYKGGRVRCVSSPSETGGGTQAFEIGDELTRDKHTQLEWQRFPDSATRDFAEATEYCEELELEGRGWHLPSLKELLTIVDPSRYQPSINVRAFGWTQNERYWSSSEYLDGPDVAYQVDFAQGGSWTDGTYADKHYVRCVR